MIDPAGGGADIPSSPIGGDLGGGDIGGGSPLADIPTGNPGGLGTGDLSGGSLSENLINGGTGNGQVTSTPAQNLIQLADASGTNWTFKQAAPLETKPENLPADRSGRNNLPRSPLVGDRNGQVSTQPKKTPAKKLTPAQVQQRNAFNRSRYAATAPLPPYILAGKDTASLANAINKSDPKEVGILNQTRQNLVEHYKLVNNQNRNDADVKAYPQKIVTQAEAQIAKHRETITASEDPTKQPDKPEGSPQAPKAPITHDGFTYEVRTQEEADLVSEQIARGKSGKEIQDALEHFRANQANKTGFPNQLSNQLDQEIRIAESLGAKPISPTDKEAFENAVNQGTIKFVVTQNGELLITPKHIQGIEISHAILSRGANVLTAGEADIAISGGARYGLDISEHSGHFKPSKESLSIAKQLFKKYGITF